MEEGVLEESGVRAGVDQIWDLRPKRLSEYIGQPRVVESLEIAITAAGRGENPWTMSYFIPPRGWGRRPWPIL